MLPFRELAYDAVGFHPTNIQPLTHTITMGFISEFKDFAMKGNVMDMAVGVIIGGAFGKIVSSLVDNVIMPIVGKFTGGVDFSTLAYSLGTDRAGEPLNLKYGAFIQSVFDFLIIAFCIFMMVKMVNRARVAIEGEPEPEVKKEPADIVLLREIRDTLQKK